MLRTLVKVGVRAGVITVGCVAIVVVVGVAAVAVAFARQPDGWEDPFG